MPGSERFVITFRKQEARRLLVYLIAADVLFAALYLLVHILMPEVRWGPFYGLLDLDSEVSIPTWFSSLQLFVIGAALFAIARFGAKHKWFLQLGAVVLVGASIDEAAGVHEKITETVNNLGIEVLQAVMIEGHGAWIVPYLAIGLVLLLVCARPTLDIMRSHRGPALLVIGGASIFVLGAVGLEILSYFLRDGADLMYSLEVAAEEFLEMIGATLVLYGVISYGFEVHARDRST